MERLAHETLYPPGAVDRLAVFFGKFVHSAEFPAYLREALEKPEPEGIGWNAAYDYLELWVPIRMNKGDDTSLRELLYYDEIQELLSDKYTNVW